MKIRRFSIQTVFWITLVAAAFLGGRLSMTTEINRRDEELRVEQEKVTKLLRVVDRAQGFENAFLKQVQVGSMAADDNDEMEKK